MGTGGDHGGKVPGKARGTFLRGKTSGQRGKIGKSGPKGIKVGGETRLRPTRLERVETGGGELPRGRLATGRDKTVPERGSGRAKKRFLRMVR